MKKSKKIVSYLLLNIVVIFLFGCDGPDTYVYLGHQVPKQYIEEVKNLELLQNDEKIQYFYSDGITDIKEGLYFVTDQKLVAYNKEWQEPKTIISFDEITSLDIEYNDSFFEDSFITVVTDEFELDFPVSSEKKRDKDFYNYILQKSNLKKVKKSKQKH